MRVLVTGDAGFIGFHLTRRLLNQGHVVLGIDGMTDYYDTQLKKDRLDQLPSQNFTHVTQMVEDREGLSKLFTDFVPDAVVHLAAQAGVRYSIEQPTIYLDSNVDGTFSVLDACRLARPKHLLIASTSSVYGGNLKVPFAEIDRTDAPVSLYAATKKAAEALAHSYSYLYQIPTTVFRFFTVYGAWGRPDMALFKFVDAIQTGRPIDVYGYGKMRRDFTHVDDIIDGIERLIGHQPVVGQPMSEVDSLSAVAPFRSVNLGAGRPTGLLELITEIEKVLGIEAKKKFLPVQAGDMIETFADTTLLEQIVGQVPSTSLADGVRSFVDWFIRYKTAREEAAGSNNFR